MAIQISITGVRPMLAAHRKTVVTVFFLVATLLVEIAVRGCITGYVYYHGPFRPDGQSLQLVQSLFDAAWWLVLLALCARLVLMPPKESIQILFDGQDVSVE